MSVAVRVIPCLDVDAGRVVKGVNFVDLRDAGDPVELARAAEERGFESVFMPDHSHIPATRQSPWPGSITGEPLPPSTGIGANVSMNS